MAALAVCQEIDDVPAAIVEKTGCVETEVGLFLVGQSGRQSKALLLDLQATREEERAVHDGEDRWRTGSDVAKNRGRDEASEEAAHSTQAADGKILDFSRELV